jgi:ElaA protein
MRWTNTAFAELTTDVLYQMMVLRQEVFVVEQNSPYQDADGGDLKAHHLLGWEGEALIAYLRLFAPGLKYTEASLGRVVVAKSARGRQLGQTLMRRAMALIQELHGPVPVRISAQSHLRRFYEDFGFTVDGEGYLEDGIPHLPMVTPIPDHH